LGKGRFERRWKGKQPLSQNGSSQAITDGIDGFVLQNPKDSAALSHILRSLYEDRGLCQSVGEHAARTVRTLAWERNAAQAWDFLNEALCWKTAQVALQRSEKE
jgi:glycosyltransferase involved in cell wall biosynthesis